MLPAPSRERFWVRINNYLGFTPKDWVTVSFSALALIISAVSAYFNLVRREDNLSVVIDGFPFVHQVDSDNLAITSEDTTLAFINSGTRSAAVTSVNIFFLQHDGASRCSETSTGSDGVWFATTFQPVAVKANEVVTQKINISHPFRVDSSKRNDKGWYLLRLNNENKSKKIVNVEVCYAIFVATPSVATHVEHLSGVEFRLQGQNTLFDPIDPNRPPKLLLRSSGTIFGG
jgi:hypothetical protein